MNTSRVVVNVTIGGLLVLLLAAAGGYADGVTLRYKFVPQQQIAYQLWASGTGNVSFSGIPMAGEDQLIREQLQAQFNANISLNLDVKSVDEQGNGVVSLSVSELRMQGQAMGESGHLVVNLDEGTVEVNGEVAQIPPQGLSQIQGLLEQIQITISPQGKVLDIAGLPQLPPSEQTGITVPWQDTESWQELLASIPAALPEGPVAVGDSWEAAMPIPMPGIDVAELPEFAVECTLKKIGEVDGHRVADIGYYGSMEVADLVCPLPGPPGGGAGPPQFNLNLEAIEEGNAYFDLETGQVHSARGNILINIGVEVPLPEEAAQFFDVLPGVQINLRIHFVLSPSE